MRAERPHRAKGTSNHGSRAASNSPGTQSTVTASSSPADVQVKLYNKDSLSFVRDLLFVIGVFAYLIGYAFHSSEMSVFTIQTDLADQPLMSLVTWAAAAISVGWIGYLLIFVIVLVLLVIGGVCQRRLVEAAHYRPIIYGIVTMTIVWGLIASYGWSSKAGKCVAETRWYGGATVPHISLVPAKGVQLAALPLDRQPQFGVRNPVQILAETASTYELLVNQGARYPIPVVVPRSEVASIVYYGRSLDLSRDAAASVHTGPPSPARLAALPTVPPEMAGKATAPPTPGTPDCVPGLNAGAD